MKTHNQILLIVMLIALPGSLLYFSGGSFAWIKGSFKLLESESIYSLLQEGDVIINNRYNYLPVFAIANGILLLPFKFIIELFVGSTSEYLSTAYVTYLLAGTIVTGMWSYISLICIPWMSRHLFSNEKSILKGTVVLITFPWLFKSVISDSADPLVALLALSGIVLAQREKWVYVGIIIGLSTFKFTGVPFALVIFFYAILSQELRDIAQLAVGGIISQIPNLAYFLLQPGDFYFLLENRGGVSTHAWEFSSGAIFLKPIQFIGIESMYKDGIFPVAILIFSLLGAYVAVNYRNGLVAGFAVGYFSTSWLIPAEQAFFPFAIFVLIICIDLLNTVEAKVIVIITHTVSGYYLMTASIGTKSHILGLTSEHITYVGFSSGTVLMSYVVQITLPIMFVYLLYLQNKRYELGDSI